MTSTGNLRASGSIRSRKSGSDSGSGASGIGVLVIGPRLVPLERSLQVEDRPPMLDRDGAARGEALAVARAIDLVKDWSGGIARPQEVGVEGVRRVALDRAAGGDQGLAEHLSPEDPLGALLRAAAAEEVHLQLFEIEDSEQRIERPGHARLRSRIAGR